MPSSHPADSTADATQAAAAPNLGPYTSLAEQLGNRYTRRTRSTPATIAQRSEAVHIINSSDRDNFARLRANPYTNVLWAAWKVVAILAMRTTRHTDPRQRARSVDALNLLERRLAGNPETTPFTYTRDPHGTPLIAITAAELLLLQTLGTDAILTATPTFSVDAYGEVFHANDRGLSPVSVRRHLAGLSPVLDFIAEEIQADYPLDDPDRKAGRFTISGSKVRLAKHKGTVLAHLEIMDPHTRKH